MKTTGILNLNIVTLILTHFLWGFVNFVYSIQIQPYLLTIYGTSHEAVPFLGTVLSLGSLSAVIPLLLGFCADLYGRKKVIIFGECVSVLGIIGLSLGSSEMYIIYN